MFLSVVWNVSPKLFSIGGIEIQWYSFLWVLGIIVVTIIGNKMFREDGMTEKQFDALFVCFLVGHILGARLGHCLFYEPEYYFSHPLEILQIWKGGMASHGGVAGIIIAVWIHARYISGKGIIWTLDRMAALSGFGAAMIRLGNLMNSEIYGMPTTLPWGFKFVRDMRWYMPLTSGGSGRLPCHPTQFYEALVYLVLFGVSMWMYWKTDARERKGFLLGINMIVIFFSRMLIEYLKYVQEPFELILRKTIGLDMGQLLSLPFIIWGIYLVWNARKNHADAGLAGKNSCG